MKTVSNDKSEVASLDKAIRTLKFLSTVEGDVTLTTLAENVDLPKSTLVRLLNTLKGHGMVLQDDETKRYRLGWALIYMGQAATKSFNLIKLIHPHLDQLSRETGESASLIMLRKNKVVYVDQVSGNNMIRGVPRIGAELFLHASASGKVLLSHLTEKQVNQILAGYAFTRFTDKTICDPAVFREVLSQTHSLGYALDDEEGELGCRCIAAPITDWNGKIVASVTITGPTSRIGLDDIPRLADTVVRIAKQASLSLRPAR
ncbi:MAG: IclR family transcriptional regulator [Clostridia bacterium]